MYTICKMPSFETFVKKKTTSFCTAIFHKSVKFSIHIMTDEGSATYIWLNSKPFICIFVAMIHLKSQSDM